MNTLEKLMEKLTVSESPGLEAFDERFGAIGDHAQARRFGQAAELFEQLIDEDISKSSSVEQSILKKIRSK